MEIVDKEMALGVTPAGQVVICDLEQELQRESEEIADVEEEIIAEPENSEHQEELRKLRQKVKFLKEKKRKLETESNKSFMESTKSIGLAMVCGIVIGAVGVVAVPARVAMKAGIVMVAVARKASIERLS